MAKVFLEPAQSKILSPKAMVAAQEVLKMSLGWTLAYSTWRDGWEFSTLFQTLPALYLVLFQLQTDTVLGVVLQGALSPSEKVLGHGASSKLLKIVLKEDDRYVSDPSLPLSPNSFPSAPTITTFNWIGIQEPNEYANLVALTAAGEVPGEVLAALNCFATCRSDHLTFGASVEHACSALRLDANDMSVLHVGPSETFCNPALVPGVGEGAAVHKLKEIEVFAC